MPIFIIQHDDTQYRIVDDVGNEGELVEFGLPATLCVTNEDGIDENFSTVLTAKPGDGDLPDGEGVVAQIIAHETEIEEVDFEEVGDDDDDDDEDEDEEDEVN